MTSLRERVLAEAERVQRIPAPTFHEQKRAKYVLDRFREEGLSFVEMDEVGNVYSCIEGTGQAPPVILSAHLDTVFPIETDLSLRKENGYWYGPGIGDNSLGVAGLLGACWGMAATNVLLPGDLWLVANTGEEGLGNLRGMRAVVDRFESNAKAFIILEGMAYGKVYHQSLGVERFEISCMTDGGHSWNDAGTPSAIHALAELIAALLKIPLPTDPRTTMNVGRIIGGTSINTIAARASLELDLRSVDAGSLTRLVDEVHGQIAEEEATGIRFEVRLIGSRPAGAISRRHALVQLAAKAIRAQGDEPELAVGSTDANIPHSRGLPAVCVGLTQGGAAHTTNEFIHTDPLDRGLNQLMALIAGAYRIG